MKEYIYPYRSIRGISSPIIPVKIMKGDKIARTYTYADSGATYSVFSDDEAEKLGMDMETGEELYLITGDGGSILIYLHEVKIEIGDCEFNAVVGFSDRLGIGFNILGRKDVFERLIFCFDDNEKGITDFRGMTDGKFNNVDAPQFIAGWHEWGLRQITKSKIRYSK